MTRSIGKSGRTAAVGIARTSSGRVLRPWSADDARTEYPRGSSLWSLDTIATSDGEQVTAPYSKDLVKDAPRVDPDGELSQREEAELYRHYGVDYGESRSESGLPGGGPDAGNGERGVGAGTGRLKKHLVSEKVIGTFPTERDRVVIETEPTDTDVAPDA